MGFFDLKVKCIICGNDVGLNRYQLSKNIWICPSCLKVAGGISNFQNLKNMDIEDIKELVSSNQEKLESFNVTKKIGNYLYIDEERKQWVIPKGSISGKIKNANIYNYSDIVNYELLEDGNSITKGGVGKAITGGILFGGIGAIVGGTTGKKKTKEICNKLQIKITVNNLNNPSEYINLIETETKKDGIIYKTSYTMAQQILSMLEIICNSSPKKEDIYRQVNTNSVADELKKFKELLDCGVITKEEFEKKKKELL
ncbi:SHOCT domain-containing protein [uncultured Clostridium sp.]|uniref:SHOCT domain-containing protein n=1 Tax=uncultured Clostridium sp. TaxID=59620 RepID=UPI002629D0DE|nr:SHOCT domain-containing protein [uncultured Clostridium sp.]